MAGLAGVAGFLDDPSALAANPAAADVKHLNGRLQFVVGECHDIGVRAVAEHHRLFLQSPLQRTEVVTQTGGALEVELLGRGVHLAFQVSGEPVRPAGQEVTEVRHDGSVLLGGHPADAGGRTLVDIAEQAGTLNLTVPFEDTVRTRSGGKDPGQQVEGLTYGPGVRVRAEVPNPLAARPPVDTQPRELLVERHREHRIGLVVPVADVESRIELLDPVVFELQGLDLCGHHRPLDFGRGGDHLSGPGVQARDIREIRCQAAAQALGLADVNDPPVGVRESVHARLEGYRPRGRSVRRGIRHRLQASTGPHPDDRACRSGDTPPECAVYAPPSAGRGRPRGWLRSGW